MAGSERSVPSQSVMISASHGSISLVRRGGLVRIVDVRVFSEGIWSTFCVRFLVGRNFTKARDVGEVSRWRLSLFRLRGVTFEKSQGSVPSVVELPGGTHTWLSIRGRPGEQFL